MASEQQKEDLAKAENIKISQALLNYSGQNEQLGGALRTGANQILGQLDLSTDQFNTMRGEYLNALSSSGQFVRARQYAENESEEGVSSDVTNLSKNILSAKDKATKVYIDAKKKLENKDIKDITETEVYEEARKNHKFGDSPEKAISDARKSLEKKRGKNIVSDISALGSAASISALESAASATSKLSQYEYMSSKENSIDGFHGAEIARIRKTMREKQIKGVNEFGETAAGYVTGIGRAGKNAEMGIEAASIDYRTQLNQLANQNFQLVMSGLQTAASIVNAIK